MKAFFLLFLLASAVRAADPTPGEWNQTLDGAWQFTIDAALLDQSDGWDTINVPGNWDTLPRYATHRGKGWYRRTFTVPANWRGKRVRLCFGAVYHEAEVTLNGQGMGTHVGGYTPFEFDVTGRLDYGGVNTVVVCADNTYHRGAWWPWGGISRDVTLVANRPARIVWQHIHAEPDLATGAARILVRYKLGNDGAAELPAGLTATITAPSGRSVGTWQLDAALPAHAETMHDATFDLPASAVSRWDFDHPNLYTLTTELRGDREVLHARMDHFGIRKVETTPDGLRLNGELVRVPGFNRVSDSNRTGNTEPNELVRRDVDAMKCAGAVFARLMHTPQAPNLLDYLDEKGMMIFCEVPVWGQHDPHMSADDLLVKQWLREMIERDYNHPCIVGWSTGNELNEHYAYVAAMNAYVHRELDPYRLVGYVSNTAYHPGYGPESEPVTVSDLAMINQYGSASAFDGTAGIVRGRWPGKPVFYAEYGNQQIGASPEATIPGVEQIWANLARDSFVIGGALWTFNDYRSDMDGTPPSGNREWGIVDVERRPKAAYQQVRKLYSPVHALGVENGRATLQPRRRTEIPSYPLRGYHVIWELYNAVGRTTARGSFALPDLVPDAPAWTSPDIPGAAEAARVRVSLVTPTGYDVEDASGR